MKIVKKRRRLLFCVIAGILLCFSAVSFCTAKSTEARGGKELLVTFEAGVTKRQAKKTIKKIDAVVETGMFQRDETSLLVRLELPRNKKGVISALKKDPAVASVQVNRKSRAESVSASRDPLMDWQWNLDYMDVPEAWDLIDRVKPQSERSEQDKVIVATLDTGADYRHPDLQENLDTENCVSVAGKKAPYPVYGKKLLSSHGTSTAGIIAATSNNGIGMAGIAAGNNNDLISLMAIDVFPREGYDSQASASTADIIKGIEYACDKGAKVISMCLGHTKGDSDLFGSPHDDAALEAAINDAVYNKDVLVVCSAGNNANTRKWYPSDFDAAVSVINTKKYKNAWKRKCKSRFSNYGSAKDISAPGKNVYTTVPNGSYRRGCGTSMAAPSVAGVAALVRYVNPRLSAAEVKEILYSTATDLYKPGYDIYTGYGNVNAYRAVAAAAGVDDGLKTPKLSLPKSASANSAGPHSIMLSWKKVPRANGYFIYRADKKDGEYQLIKKTRKARTLSYKDRGREFNKPFYYKIVAYGTSRDGKKMLSPESPVVTSSARCGVPSLKAQSRNARAIRLSWPKADGADGYQIYRSDSRDGGYELIQTLGAKKRSWTNRDLTSGETYYYKIRAYCHYRGSDFYSEQSAAASARATLAKPGFSISKKGGRQIVLKRKKVDSVKITSCEVYRRTEDRKWRLIQTMPAGERVFTDRRLKPGKKYSYQIRTYKTVQGKRIYSDMSKVKSKRL